MKMLEEGLICTSCHVTLEPNLGESPLNFNFCPNCGHEFDFMGIAIDILSYKALICFDNGNVLGFLDCVALIDAIEDIK